MPSLAASEIHLRHSNPAALVVTGFKQTFPMCPNKVESYSVVFLTLNHLFAGINRKIFTVAV